MSSVRALLPAPRPRLPTLNRWPAALDSTPHRSCSFFSRLLIIRCLLSSPVFLACRFPSLMLFSIASFFLSRPSCSRRACLRFLATCLWYWARLPLK